MKGETFSQLLFWAMAAITFLMGIGIGITISEIFLPRGKSRFNEMREQVAAGRFRQTATTLNAMADALDGKPDVATTRDITEGR